MHASSLYIYSAGRRGLFFVFSLFLCLLNRLISLTKALHALSRGWLPRTCSKLCMYSVKVISCYFFGLRLLSVGNQDSKHTSQWGMLRSVDCIECYQFHSLLGSGIRRLASFEICSWTFPFTPPFLQNVGWIEGVLPVSPLHGMGLGRGTVLYFHREI